tara:strand:+ start:304 stop:567 length:264 start_codon:yes stop_codon:yes gene_type:complete
MNEPKITKFEHAVTSTLPIYGGTRTVAEYNLETIQNGIRNDYTVKAEIRGIATGDLHLNVIEVIRDNNNEETLIDSAVTDLFEEYIG